MASSEGESLFSFEVAVEYLRIDAATVACRFPAVAIRLLDFPTLLIPHVDKEEQDRLKTALLFDSYGELPLKFKELLDARGNFQINKGKSCMFKFDLSSLYNHLHNVPLYAMITDLWNDVAKLVGVSTIPLSNIISKIKNDVQLKGLSYPSVHGDKDTYPVFNLMGSQVGVLSLGYRVLSLGTSLIPHIPSTSISQGKTLSGKGNFGDVDLSLPRKKSVDLGYIDEESRTSRIVEHPLPPVEEQQDDTGAVRPNVSIFRGEGDGVFQDNAIDSGSAHEVIHEKAKIKHSHQQTQTGFQKTSDWRGAKPVHGNDDDFDIAIVVNTHCPPPLIFNAQWDPNVSRAGPARSVTNYEKRGFPEEEEEEEEEAVLSESSESILSKSMEVQYRLQSNSPENVRKIIRQSSSRLSTNKVSYQSSKGKLATQEPLKLDKKYHQDRLKGRTLPILTALLQELSILTGTSSDHFNKTMEELISESKENIQPLQEDEGSTPVYPSKPAVTLPYEQKHQSCRHKLCAVSSKPVPPTKGWLRQEPVLKKRETKLQFKMTYSQKLRLKKNNPELLKRLEAEEDRQSLLKNAERTQRKTRNRQQKDMKATYAPSSSSRHSVTTRDVTRHYREKKESNREVPLKSDSKFKVHSEGRRPIPTPRKHLTMEEQETPDQFELLRYEDTGTGFETAGSASHHDDAISHEYDLTSGEKSGRSIEVFIPSPSLLESDRDSGSERELAHEDDEDDGYEQRRDISNQLIPGFPTHSVESEVKGSGTHSSHSQVSKFASGSTGGYSNTFDDSKSSYHTPLDEDGRSENGVKISSEGTSRGSASPSFSSDSQDSVKDHPQRALSMHHQTLVSNGADESGIKVQEEEGEAHLLLLMQEGSRLMEVRDYKEDRHPREQRQSVLSRLELPKPPLSSRSPIPQPRHPPSKILMTKPMTVNDNAYNNQSVEVNLPSDLSVSFDSTHQQRNSENLLESSQDVVRDGPCGDRASLEVIKSEPEDSDQDSKNDGSAYSEDFVSDFEDSDH